MEDVYEVYGRCSLAAFYIYGSWSRPTHIFLSGCRVVRIGKSHVLECEMNYFHGLLTLNLWYVLTICWLDMVYLFYFKGKSGCLRELCFAWVVLDDCFLDLTWMFSEILFSYVVRTLRRHLHIFGSIYASSRTNWRLRRLSYGFVQLSLAVIDFVGQSWKCTGVICVDPRCGFGERPCCLRLLIFW